MRRNKGSARFIIIITVMLLSVVVVNNIMAQGTTTPTNTPLPSTTPLPTTAPSNTPLPTATTAPSNTPLPTHTATTVPTATRTSTPVPSATVVPSKTLAPTHTATTVVVAVSNKQAAGPTATVKAATATPITTTATATIGTLTVTQSEPSRITSGQEGTLSIIGTNFTDTTTVRLIGYGFLTTTFLNTNALTANLPSSIPVGTYVVEVRDGSRGTVNAPTPLTVIAAPVTATPVPNLTAAPTATEIPGQPKLIIRSFTASPSSILPGGTTQIALEVVNVGNRTAQGIVASLGDSKFSPASGQASVTVPDLAASSAYVVSLAVVAPADATEGSATIPFVLTSRDYSGKTYTDNASVSVTIVARTSQVVLSSYTVSPKSAQPGATVNVQMTLTNIGNVTASNVLIQLSTTSAVLIAGSQGNSLAIGDMPAGTSVTVTLPLVVASDAKSGVQAQGLTITYLINSESKTTAASISIQVLDKPSQASQVVLAGYAVTPKSAQPGDAVSVKMVLTNSGNQTASQVLIQLNDTNAVLIAGAKGNSLAVGEMKAKASKTVTLPLVVANDAKSGVQAQAFTISYLQGSDAKTTTASISLEIKAKPSQAAQVVLANYSVAPTTAAPGDAVNVQMTLTNSGNETASQVLVQLSDTNAVLVAGAQGSSVAVGDLAANASKTVTLPVVVANGAKTGVQAQAFTISYLQGSDAKTTTVSVSLGIKAAIKASTVLLLKSYSTGQDTPLQPGQQFTYSMIIQNAGTAGVSNLLITFGTVKTDSSSTTSSTTTTVSSTSTSTTASTNFAPIGSGDTVFVGNVPAGQTASLSQNFIVSNSASSGIYSLPITLQYVDSDGTSTQQSLNASLTVLAPTNLRANLTTSLPDKLTAGETYTLAIKLANLGSSKVAVSKMSVKGENVTVTKGAEALLDPLASEDYSTQSVSIQTKAAGAYKVTVEVAYVDALNRAQTYTTTFTGEVAAPVQQNPGPMQPVQPANQNQNLLGRLLLGFLGLGG